MKLMRVALLCLFALALDLSWSLQANSAQVAKIPLKAVETEGLGPFKTPRMTYVADLIIGNPYSTLQLFKVQFDTSKPYFWVPHYELSRANPHNLHFEDGLRCEQSKTCKVIEKDLKFNYGNMTMKALLVNDTIQLRGMDSSVWTKFTAISSVDVDLTKLPVDGFFGLAPHETTFGGDPSPLVAMQQAGVIPQAMYGLWFDRTIENEGELSLGGDNKERHYGDFTWFNSSTGDSWKFNLTGVYVGRKLLGCGPNDGCNVEINSAISETYGDAKVVAKIYESLGVKMFGDLPIIDCDFERESDLTVSIAGHPRAFEARNFIHPYNSKTCFVRILPHPEPNSWILGVDFLSDFYTLYDVSQKRMGMAASRKEPV